MLKAFVVKGTDTIKSLQEKLEYMGLTLKELNVNPEPDSILRIFMVYKALDEFVEVRKPVLDTFERNGFTVIEWCGTELR